MVMSPTSTSTPRNERMNGWIQTCADVCANEHVLGVRGIHLHTCTRGHERMDDTAMLAVSPDTTGSTVHTTTDTLDACSSTGVAQSAQHSDYSIMDKARR